MPTAPTNTNLVGMEAETVGLAAAVLKAHQLPCDVVRVGEFEVLVDLVKI